ncbi:hypothetical protein PR048_032483 [Dryococelus australis]|uniref:Uncharacterized protein n=1 Tax=Dryococelus australis TaxID=614101 RepID=A0ABQ9G5H2_9NEOP|nr:hypothetical protein PR048_032483 [Dryococelus australis]
MESIKKKPLPCQQEQRQSHQCGSVLRLQPQHPQNPLPTQGGRRSSPRLFKTSTTSSPRFTHTSCSSNVLYHFYNKPQALLKKIQIIIQALCDALTIIVTPTLPVLQLADALEEATWANNPHPPILHVLLLTSTLKNFLQLFLNQLHYNNDPPFSAPEATNYWSVRVLAALKQKDCWEAVESGYDETDIKKLSFGKRRENDKVLSLLTLVVSDTYLDDIGRYELASGTWEILEGIHTNYGLLHMNRILKEMMNTTRTDDVTMQECMSKIQNLNRKLIKGA